MCIHLCVSTYMHLTNVSWQSACIRHIPYSSHCQDYLFSMPLLILHLVYASWRIAYIRHIQYSLHRVVFSVFVCVDYCRLLDTPYLWFRCEFHGICVRILLPGAGSCDNCQLHHWKPLCMRLQFASTNSRTPPTCVGVYMIVSFTVSLRYL